MIIDINDFSVSNFELGAKTDLLDGIHEVGSFSLRVNDGRIEWLSVLLSQFYSNGPTFNGEIEYQSQVESLTSNTQPEEISKMFPSHFDHWDDGVEVNYQYLIDGIEIEFSWHHSTNGLVANYISMEVT